MEHQNLDLDKMFHLLWLCCFVLSVTLCNAHLQKLSVRLPGDTETTPKLAVSIWVLHIYCIIVCLRIRSMGLVFTVLDMYLIFFPFCSYHNVAKTETPKYWMCCSINRQHLPSFVYQKNNAWHTRAMLSILLQNHKVVSTELVVCIAYDRSGFN